MLVVPAANVELLCVEFKFKELVLLVVIDEVVVNAVSHMLPT